VVTIHPTIADQRAQVRYNVDLPSTAEFPTTIASLRVLDLSYGGARIEMPMHVSLYEIRQVQALTIAGSLYAKVAWRWSKDKQAGLQFVAPDLVRNAVDDLIQAEIFKSGG